MSDAHSRISFSLLISPYWNVNFYADDTAYYVSVLLISPYWNVNSAICAVPTAPVSTFNLSILECKC